MGPLPSGALHALFTFSNRLDVLFIVPPAWSRFKSTSSFLLWFLASNRVVRSKSKSSCLSNGTSSSITLRTVCRCPFRHHDHLIRCCPPNSLLQSIRTFQIPIRLLLLFLLLFLRLFLLLLSRLSSRSVVALHLFFRPNFTFIRLLVTSTLSSVHFLLRCRNSRLVVAAATAASYPSTPVAICFDSFHSIH